MKRHRKWNPALSIPKKKGKNAGLLVEVKQNSREYQHDILPAVTKSFRHSHSSQRFRYNRVQSVHNPQLTEAFMERRKALRLDGYSEKEVADSFAYLCVDCEDDVISICRDGISIGNSEVACLGHPKMGVQLSRHADILKPNGLQSGYQGYMVVFKVVKGRVKSVAENRSALYLEPTPNFDCHVSNDINFSSTQSLFESTQLYLYQYGDEGVMEVPKNICPCVVLRFTYRSLKDRKVSDPSPRLHVTKPVPSVPSSAKEEESFFVWGGQLTVKGLYACNVEMRSVAGCTKPARIGKDINITHKMSITEARQKYLKHLTEIRRKCEGYHNGFYMNICELQPCSSTGKPQFQKVMNYLGKYNCVAVKKLENDVTLLLLTASELTFQLGLTKPHQYPVILYCLFLSKKSCIRDFRTAATVGPSPSNHKPTTSSSQMCSVATRRDQTSPLNLILPDNPFPSSSSISPSKSPSKVGHKWADTKEHSPQHNTSSTWSRPCYGSPESNVNSSNAYHSPTNMPPPPSPSPVRAGWPHSPHQSTVRGPGTNMWARSYPNPQTPPISKGNSCPQFPVGPPHTPPIMPPSSPTGPWTNLPPPSTLSTPPPVGIPSPPPYPLHSPVHNVYSPVSPACSRSQSPSRLGYSLVSSAGGLGSSHSSLTKPVDQHHMPAPATSNHWQPWESTKSGVKRRNFEFEEYFYAIPPKSSLLNADKLKKEFKEQAKALELHIALQHQLKKQQQPESVKRAEKTCNNNNNKEVIPKDQIPVVIQDKNEMQKMLDKKIKEKSFDQKLEAKAMRQMLDKQLEQSRSPKKSENTKKQGTISTFNFTNISVKHIADNQTKSTNSLCENENLPIKQKHVCDSSEASPAKKSKIEEVIEMKKFLNNVIETTTLRKERKLFNYDSIVTEKSGSIEKGSVSQSPSVKMSSKSPHKSSKQHSSNTSSRISSTKSNSSREREGKIHGKQDGVKGNKMDRSEKSSPLSSKLKSTSKLSKGKVAKSWLDVNREKFAKSGVLPALLPSDIKHIGRIPKKGDKSTVAKLSEKMQCLDNSSSVECCSPSQEASLDASLMAAMAVDKSNSQMSDITMDLLLTNETDGEIDSINIDQHACDSKVSQNFAKRTESGCKDISKGMFGKDSPSANTVNVQSFVHGSSPHGNSTNTSSDFNITYSPSFLSPAFTVKDVHNLDHTKGQINTSHSSFPLMVPTSRNTLSTNRHSTSKDTYFIPGSQNCNSEFTIDNHAGRHDNESPSVKQNDEINESEGASAKHEKENTKTRSRKTSMHVDEDQPFKKLKLAETSKLPQQSRGPLKERLKNRRGSSNMRKGSEKETENLMNAIYSSAVFSVRSRTSSPSSVHGDQDNILDSPRHMLKHALSVSKSNSFQFGKTDTFPNIKDIETNNQDILLLQDDEMDDNVFDEDIRNNDNNNAVDREPSTNSNDNIYSKTRHPVQKDDAVIGNTKEIDLLDKDQLKIHSDKFEFRGRSYYSSVSDEDMGKIISNPERVVELPGNDMRITIRNNLDSSTINRYQSLDRMVREVLNGGQWPSRQSSSEISLINTVYNVLHKYTLGSADQRQVQGITDDADIAETLSEDCPTPVEMLIRKHDIVNWRPSEAIVKDIMAEEKDIQINLQKDLETPGSQDQRISRMVENKLEKDDTSSRIIDDSNAECSKNIEKVPNDDTIDVGEKDKTTEVVGHSNNSLAERLRVLSELTVPESATAKLSHVADSPETTKSGPVRTDKMSRKNRKAHPYQKKKGRRDSWSFDIPYKNLQELMKNLTTATFLERHRGKPKPPERCGESRFRNFRFRRSAIPDFLPESQSESDDFTEDMIPDFEERKRKAEMVDSMMGKNEEEQHFTKEQNIYIFVGGENSQETQEVTSGLGRSSEEISYVQIGSVKSEESNKVKSKIKIKRNDETKSSQQEKGLNSACKTDIVGDLDKNIKVKVENCNENTTKDAKKDKRGTSKKKYVKEKSNHSHRKDEAKKLSNRKESKYRKDESDRIKKKNGSDDNSSSKKNFNDHKDKSIKKSLKYGESVHNNYSKYVKKIDKSPYNKQREKSLSRKDNANDENFVKQHEDVGGKPSFPDHEGYVSSEDSRVVQLQSLESSVKIKIPSSTLPSSICTVSAVTKHDSIVHSQCSLSFPVEQGKFPIRELTETKDDKDMPESLKARLVGLMVQDHMKSDCRVNIPQQRNEMGIYEDVALDHKEMQLDDEIDSDWIIVDELECIDEKMKKDLPETSNKQSDSLVDTSENVGDRTVTDVVDMNISELEESDQQEARTFVPVVYLSGVKGHKHQWCKDYDIETIRILHKTSKIADGLKTNEDKSVLHDDASSSYFPVLNNSSQVSLDLKLIGENMNNVPDMTSVNSDKALNVSENRNESSWNMAEKTDNINDHVEKSLKPDVFAVSNLQQMDLQKQDAHQEELLLKEREDSNGMKKECMGAEGQNSSSFGTSTASNELEEMETCDSKSQNEGADFKNNSFLYDKNMCSKDQAATVTKRDHLQQDKKSKEMIKEHLKEKDYFQKPANKFLLKKEDLEKVNKMDKPGKEIMPKDENIRQNENTDEALSSKKDIQQEDKVENTIVETSEKEEDLSSKEVFTNKIEHKSVPLEAEVSNSVLQHICAVICNEHFDITKTSIKKDSAEQNIGMDAEPTKKVLETVDVHSSLEDKATATIYAETQSPVEDTVVVEEAFCIEILNTNDGNQKNDEVQSLGSDSQWTEAILKHLENSNTTSNEDLSGMYFIFDEDRDISLGAELEIDDMIKLTKGDGTEFCDQADSEFVEEHNIDPTLILHDASLSNCVIPDDKGLQLQDTFISRDANEQNREEDTDISIKIDDEEYSEWQESEKQKTKGEVQNSGILGATSNEKHYNSEQEKKYTPEKFIEDFNASSFENNQTPCSKSKTYIWNRLQKSSCEKEKEVDSGESVVADSQDESEIDDFGILSLCHLSDTHIFLKNNASCSITDDGKSVGEQNLDESPNGNSSKVQMEVTLQGEELSPNSEKKESEITEVLCRNKKEPTFHQEVISSADNIDGIDVAMEDRPLQLNFTTPINQRYAGLQKRNQISVKGSITNIPSDICKDRPSALSQNVQEVTPLVHSTSAGMDGHQNKNLADEQEQPKVGNFLPAQNLYLGNELLPTSLPFVYHQQNSQPSSSFIMYDERQPYLAYLPYAPPVQRIFPFPVISSQIQPTPTLQAHRSSPDLVSRDISLHQHGIMSCLDPNIQHFTNCLRQQLQSRIFSTVGTIGSPPSLTGNVPQVNGSLSQPLLNLSQPCHDASYKDLYLSHRLNSLRSQQGNAPSNHKQSPYLEMDNALYCRSRAADNPLNFSNLLQGGINPLPIADVSNSGMHIRESVPEVTLPPISTFTQRPLSVPSNYSELNSSAQDEVSATVPLDLAYPKVQALPSVTLNTGRPPVGRVNPIPKNN